MESEELLDPELPVCDAHHHLWAHRGKYLVDEFLKDVRSGHNVVSSVFVEASPPTTKATPLLPSGVAETEFIERIVGDHAASSRVDVAAAIVGHADLTQGSAVRRVLEAHVAASPTRFRGIRQSATWDANSSVRGSARGPRLLLDSRFREGLACLKQLELVFDVWVFHTQLDDVVSVASAFPEITFVLNHAGGPLGIGPYAGRRQEILSVWRRNIARVAQLPNVFVKLGGLGMPRCGFGWEKQPELTSFVKIAEATAPYYLHCIEHFGSGRCMFESNFPVDKQSYTYRNLWNAFKFITKDFSYSEKAVLFHDTACKVYRIHRKPLISQRPS